MCLFLLPLSAINDIIKNNYTLILEIGFLINDKYAFNTNLEFKI